MTYASHFHPGVQKVEFDSHFCWKEKIAAGTRGPLYRAVCTRSYRTKIGKQIAAGTEVAVKVFLLERMSTSERAQLQTEFQILRAVGDIDSCEEILDGFQTEDDLILVKKLTTLTPIAAAVSSAAGQGHISEALVAGFLESAFSVAKALGEKNIVHANIDVRDVSTFPETAFHSCIPLAAEFIGSVSHAFQGLHGDPEKI